MPRKSTSSGAKPTRAIVTFPIHVTGATWEAFKERARRDGQSAHGVLIAFIEQYASAKPKTKRTSR